MSTFPFKAYRTRRFRDMARRWKSPFREFERSGVGFTDGKTFLGEGFVRINFACARSTLMEGLRRMELAVINGYRKKH